MRNCWSGIRQDGVWVWEMRLGIGEHTKTLDGIILFMMVYGFEETTAEGLEAPVLWIYHVVWATIAMRLINGKPGCGNVSFNPLAAVSVLTQVYTVICHLTQSPPQHLCHPARF
jgi:hypothetical protein